MGQIVTMVLQNSPGYTESGMKQFTQFVKELLQERNLFASIGRASETYWAGNTLLGFMPESIWKLFSLMQTFQTSRGGIAAQLEILPGWRVLAMVWEKLEDTVYTSQKEVVPILHIGNNITIYDRV